MIKLLDLVIEEWNGITTDFRHIACESFALALNKQFGYKFAALYSKKENWYLHIFCYKNNKYVDVDGVQTLAEICKKFKNGAEFEGITLKECVLLKKQNQVKNLISRGFDKVWYSSALKKIGKNLRKYQVA